MYSSVQTVSNDNKNREMIGKQLAVVKTFKQKTHFEAKSTLFIT